MRALPWAMLATTLIAFNSIAAEKIPPNIAAAVADPNRPEADRARDADRKPAECLAFAGVKPGDRIADLIPGTGYFKGGRAQGLRIRLHSL